MTAFTDIQLELQLAEPAGKLARVQHSQLWTVAAAQAAGEVDSR